MSLLKGEASFMAIILMNGGDGMKLTPASAAFLPSNIRTTPFLNEKERIQQLEPS